MVEVSKQYVLRQPVTKSDANDIQYEVSFHDGQYGTEVHKKIFDHVFVSVEDVQQQIEELFERWGVSVPIQNVCEPYTNAVDELLAVIYGKEKP